MTNYNFSTALSAIDFELLSKDLLEAELGIRPENFQEGRDQGIDLRYAPFPQVHTTASLRAQLHLSPPTIAQCKRYATFSSLKSALKIQELPKIARLNPPGTS